MRARRAARAAALCCLPAAAGGALSTYYKTPGWGSDAYCMSGPGDQCCCSSLQIGGQTTSCSDEDEIACYLYSWRDAISVDLTAKYDGPTGTKTDAKQIWVIVCGALVFFMQCGFAMLESGCTRKKNTQSIIFKNLIDACIGAIAFFCCGYGFAFGKSEHDTTGGKFIGDSDFFLMFEDNGEGNQHFFFFQFAFAATAATIVSGAVAERTNLVAYFIYSFFLTSFIYPVVVHWVWSPGGWLSAFNRRGNRLGENGMIDYAGSGVVHAVGGWAALVGAYFVGPRCVKTVVRYEDVREGMEIVMGIEECPDGGRYAGTVAEIKPDEPEGPLVTIHWNHPKRGGPAAQLKIPRYRDETMMWFDGDANPTTATPRFGDRTRAEQGVFDRARFRGQSTMLAALGVFILWFGWYGFNCGSTLAWDGNNAGKVATTTTLSAAMGGLTALLIGKIVGGCCQGGGGWDLMNGLNGVLAGLVSITAGCSVVDEWCAVLIGAVGGAVFYAAAELEIWLHIDDPLGAWPVHGAAGLWGCLAVGVFAQARNIERAYGGDVTCGLGKACPDYDSTWQTAAPSNGNQFAIQLAGISAIIGWTLGTCGVLFGVLRCCGLLRSDQTEELAGLDHAHHGADPSHSFQALPAGHQEQVADTPAEPGQQDGDQPGVNESQQGFLK